MRVGYLVAMVVITAAAIWLTLGALDTKKAAGAAWTLFGAFVLWCGALGFVHERGQRDVRVDLVKVDFKQAERPDEAGLYVGRSSGPIFCAIPARDSPKTGRVVVAVESDDIQSPSYGQRLNIPNHEDVKDGYKGDTRPSEEPTGRAAVHRNRN